MLGSIAADGYAVLVSRPVARRAGYIILGMYGVAMVACLWALALGVAEISKSLAGEAAAIVIAAILITGIVWRVRVKWDQLHSR